MTKDKQIEDMAIEITKAHCTKKPCEECKWCGYASDAIDCTEYLIAEHFYDAGYRKASDVAREIFERLHSHRKFDGHTVSVWLNDLVCIAKEYGIDLEGDAELKRKYTEETKNEE